MPDAPKNHGSRKFLNPDNLYPCASVTSCRLRSSWKWVRSWYLCPVKKLRSFPNILIANLALADLMNTRQHTYLRALGCTECQMVQWKDFSDYFTVSVPLVYPGQRCLHVGAAGKCVSSDSARPEVFHMEDE